MSRTHNTDPYIIRAARAQGRTVTKDWRERWSWRGAPKWRDFEDKADWHTAYEAFVNEQPVIPYGHPDRDRHSWTEECKLARGQVRMREREAISREDWDGFPHEKKSVRYWN